MVKWTLALSLFLALSTHAEFFGREFVGGSNGEVYAITPQTMTAQEAWEQNRCDLQCGETCLVNSSGLVATQCIDFCGCSSFLVQLQSSVPAVPATSSTAQYSEECESNCASICGEKGTHCLDECRSSFCVALPAENSFWYSISVGINVLVLALVAMGLWWFFKRVSTKRRRRMRLLQDQAGAYSML